MKRRFHCWQTGAPTLKSSCQMMPHPGGAKSKMRCLILLNRVRLPTIQQERNLGWSDNRNALVQAARGEYVMLLGDDDRLKPRALTILRSRIAEHPDVSLFGIGYDTIDEEGKRVFSACTPRKVSYQIGRGRGWREIFYNDAVPMWSHHPFTMCCRRSLARRFPYNRKADIGDDTLFLFEVLAARETFMALPDNCFEWRNTFALNGKYANLSAQNDRCVMARRLVWVELMGRNGLPDEIGQSYSSSLILASISFDSTSRSNLGWLTP